MPYPAYVREKLKEYNIAYCESYPKAANDSGRNGNERGFSNAGDIMTVGVIGDVHGDFSTVENIMKDNSEIKCWLCTGDLADKTMEYFSPPAPLYWISGNHENWDNIEKMDKGILNIPNLVHLANAETFQLGKTRILGLGGNLSHRSGNDY